MKRIINFAFVLLPCFFALSCNKNEGESDAQTAVLSVVVKDAQAVYEVAGHQSVTLDLTVAANPTSAEAYTITLGADPTLVAAYNAKNGTAYQMLPSGAYSFVSTSVMLPKYSAKSTTCQLRLVAESCEEDQVYLLPVVVEGVKGGTKFDAPKDKAAYILFKQLPAESEGAGTASDPYLIKDVETFLKIGSLLKDNGSVYFKLVKDLDFKDVTFTAEDPWKPFNFAGDDNDAKSAARKRKIFFDGAGHQISNFKAGGPFFAILCGSVRDLIVDNADIDNDTDDAAVIVGVAGASDDPESFTMTNVSVTNSKVYSDYKRAGALVAHMRNGTVENCDASCQVTGQQQAGGLIGRVDAGTIKDCYASGKVHAEAYYAGGLIGYVGTATVTGCYALGNVSDNYNSENYTRAGGLIGQIDGDATLEKCYAKGDVEGTGYFGGGLVGVIGAENANVTIRRCYATGSVTLPHGETGNWAHAGGLLGSINSLNAIVTISDCYATGAITVRRYSGGFVGSIYDKDKACKKLTITNSYTTSDLSGIVVAERCGVVLGLNDGSQATTPTSIVCTGFVAWNVSDKPFSYGDSVPLAGNYYGTTGTVSQQATALGWSTDIWDLSGDYPTLK